MVICSANSYPFVFLSRNKRPPIDILKFLFTTLSNWDTKVAFIQVDEDGALEIYSEFMNTCHNMNIMVKTTGGDASLLSVKSEIHNETLADITKDLILNSIHKKEIC